MVLDSLYLWEKQEMNAYYLLLLPGEFITDYITDFTYWIQHSGNLHIHILITDWEGTPNSLSGQNHSCFQLFSQINKTIRPGSYQAPLQWWEQTRILCMITRVYCRHLEWFSDHAWYGFVCLKQHRYHVNFTLRISTTFTSLVASHKTIFNIHNKLTASPCYLLATEFGLGLHLGIHLYATGTLVRPSQITSQPSCFTSQPTCRSS